VPPPVCSACEAKDRLVAAARTLDTLTDCLEQADQMTPGQEPLVADVLKRLG
jgi:hypothetical protein